jgi:hypothetical protein
MGGRNKLNVLMPMEVMVATAVHNNKMEYLDSFILMTMPAPRLRGNV